MKHSVTYIPLVHVYAVLLNTGDFRRGKLCKEEIEEKGRKNFVIQFSAVSNALQLRCLKVEEGHSQNPL